MPAKGALTIQYKTYFYLLLLVFSPSFANKTIFRKSTIPFTAEVCSFNSNWWSCLSTPSYTNLIKNHRKLIYIAVDWKCIFISQIAIVFQENSLAGCDDFDIILLKAGVTENHINQSRPISILWERLARIYRVILINKMFTAKIPWLNF